MFDCPNLAVPMSVMQHVIRVESSQNPYAIGVVGGRLARQPKSMSEAVATAQMLEQKGLNFSLGIAQVNRYNLPKYGLGSYQQAFDVCSNIQAGTRILRECYDRARDWGKAFSCYYSGNFVTGYKHGYVQKVFASMNRGDVSFPAQVGAASLTAGRRVLPPVAQAASLRASQVPSRVSVRYTQNAQMGGVSDRYLSDPAPAGSRVTTRMKQVDEDGVAKAELTSVAQDDVAPKVKRTLTDQAFVF